MHVPSDIEIAQSCQMRPITEIAAAAGVDPQYLELYGNYKAKVDPRLLKESRRGDGKLILVTAINPTPAGKAKPPPPWAWPTPSAAWGRTRWWPCGSPPWAPSSA